MVISWVSQFINEWQYGMYFNAAVLGDDEEVDISRSYV